MTLYLAVDMPMIEEVEPPSDIPPLRWFVINSGANRMLIALPPESAAEMVESLEIP